MSTEEKVQQLAFILRELMGLVVFDPRLDKYSHQYIDSLLDELEKLQEGA